MNQKYFTIVLLLGFIVSLVVPAAASASQSYGPMNGPFNGHYYQIVTMDYQELTWEEAVAAAAALPSFMGLSPHLATITSIEEQAYIAAITGSNNALWLGASDAAIEGTWTWITGEPWVYSNWNSGEPNNSGGVEHYLEWNNGGWNDNNNVGREYGYIVEYEGSKSSPALAMIIAELAMQTTETTPPVPEQTAGQLSSLPFGQPTSHGAGAGFGSALPSFQTMPISNIYVTNATLSTNSAEHNKPVTVTAIVGNKGDVYGDRVVEVYVNGQQEISTGVAVNPGEDKTVNFNISRSKPGTYRVTVDAMPAGSFTVKDDSSNMILILSTLTILMALLGLLVYTIRRRQSYS